MSNETQALAEDDLGRCIGCNEPLRVGEVVTPWDDEVGHYDCKRPASLDRIPALDADPDCPAPVVLLGNPARYVPLDTVRAAFDTRLTNPAGQADGAGELVDYEVWQDNAFGDDAPGMVASTTSLKDAQHYAAVYGQDGPTRIMVVTRRPWDAALKPAEPAAEVTAVQAIERQLNWSCGDDCHEDERGHEPRCKAAREGLTRLQAENARLRKALIEAGREASDNGWRSIETAPRDGRPILLFARAVTATAPVIVVGWHLPEQGWIESSFSCPIGIVPTHWQPLPEPPAIRARQGERG